MDQALRGSGHQVDSLSIESRAALTTEIGTAFELNRLLAGQVSAAVSSNSFPLVLAGNCNSALGILAGIGQHRLGVIWLDAHGDFNTPDTTLSGFLDGMGLAMATGRCWRSLLNTIPGFSPIPEANIVHIGARDLDPEEQQLLQESEIELVRAGEQESALRQAVQAAFDRLKDKADRLYLHVDMDVLDTGEALASRLAVPGGLSLGLVEEIVAMARERFEVSAAAITSFDPDYDRADQVLTAGIRIAKAFVS